MSDFGFGYSNDSFQDYSWFRNCIDNSTGSSSGGSSGGGESNNGDDWRIFCVIILIFIAVLTGLKYCGDSVDSKSDGRYSNSSLCVDDSYEWDEDCDSICADTIEYPVIESETAVESNNDTNRNSYYSSRGRGYYNYDDDDDECDEYNYDEYDYDEYGYDGDGWE